MESRVSIVCATAFVCLGLLLCAGGSRAQGRQSPLRVAGSSAIRGALEAPLALELERARTDLRLDWIEPGSRGALRDLLEGGVDIAMTLNRVRADEVELAERLGLELHEHAVALDPLNADSAASSGALWIYSLGTSVYVRTLLDFLRLQGGRQVLEDAGLRPLLASTSRSLERETDVSAFLIRVSFGYRGFRLGAAARQVLDGLAKSLRGPGRSAWIVGHVEPTESSREGDLSFLRAREIADYLEQQGIDPSRMKVEGVGATEPLSTHRTLEGRRQSRRVEIWVLPQP